MRLMIPTRLRTTARHKRRTHLVYHCARPRASLHMKEQVRDSPPALEQSSRLPGATFAITQTMEGEPFCAPVPEPGKRKSSVPANPSPRSSIWFRGRPGHTGAAASCRYHEHLAMEYPGIVLGLPRQGG